MTGYQRLLTDFEQNSMIYAALLAACAALVVSAIGMAMGNHKNGHLARKLTVEMLGAAALGWAFAAAIAASAIPMLTAAGVGATWSLLYQSLRIGITRLLLMRYNHFSDGLTE